MAPQPTTCSVRARRETALPAGSNHDSEGTDSHARWWQPDQTRCSRGCAHSPRCEDQWQHADAIRWGAFFKPATARIVDAEPLAEGFRVRFDVDPPNHAGHYIPNNLPDEAYRTMVTIPTVHQQAIMRLAGPNGHNGTRPEPVRHRQALRARPRRRWSTRAGESIGTVDQDGNPPDFPAQSGGNLCIINTADPPFGLIGQGTVHWLTGDSGTGKTLWMCAVCLTVVIQDPTIEVVIINYASSRDDIMKRLSENGHVLRPRPADHVHRYHRRRNNTPPTSNATTGPHG